MRQRSGFSKMLCAKTLPTLPTLKNVHMHTSASCYHFIIQVLEESKWQTTNVEGEKLAPAQRCVNPGSDP